MRDHFDHENHVKNLPDAYCKAKESNNEKILDTEKGAVDLLREAVNEIYETLDLDKAYGKTLDLYGAMIGQYRGVATDEQLRVLIKNRILRNFADGDHTSIVNAICTTFNADPSTVLLTELDKPCHVTLEGLPIEKLNESNIDIRTAVQIVIALMPVGITLDAVEFSGTFEFSGPELEYDEKAGFADEAQTIGGYFGLVSDGTGRNLPV